MVLQNSANLPGTAKTFSASVPFGKTVTTFASITVSNPITFTINAGLKMPGARTYYTLVSNGINIPDFTAFKAMDLDSGYDNRPGYINYVEFFYAGGTNYGYRIWQDKIVLPAYNNIAITFPNRYGVTINQVGQVYTSSGTPGNFWDCGMGSSQAIPQGQAGRITCKCGSPVLFGLADTNTAEIFSANNTEYYTWNASGTIFTGSLATGAINSGVSIPTPGWIRLHRATDGVVTCEGSTDGINWTLARTFGNPTLVPLYVMTNLSGGQTLEIISFEVGI